MIPELKKIQKEREEFSKLNNFDLAMLEREYRRKAEILAVLIAERKQKEQHLSKVTSSLSGVRA